jgi:hypothetical protein
LRILWQDMRDFTQLLANITQLSASKDVPVLRCVANYL